MGTVYEASDASEGRRVAVKLVDSRLLERGTAHRIRFEREARVAAKLATTHVAKVLDAGTDEARGAPYIVMELLEGEDLERLLQRLGALAPDAALRIVAQACLGIEAAHAAGVVHRDVKPANLFLARGEGGRIEVKVLDFGIAKLRRSPDAGPCTTGLTHAGSVVGSPLYMSPEQARGLKNIDHRADVWSLGVVLFRCLAGEAPHARIEAPGDLTVALCSRVPRNVQDLAPWVPPEIAAILERALLLDPDARFPSAGAMRDAIVPCLDGETELFEADLTAVEPSLQRVTAARLASERTVSVPGDTETARPFAAAGARAPDGPSTVDTEAPTAQGAGPRSGSARWPFFAAASLLAGLGATGLWVRSGVSTGAGAAPLPAISAGAPTRPVEPSEPHAITSSSTTTAHLAIAPVSASVDIDGRAARVEGGSVEIVGALGSIHRIRVADGARQRIEDVILTEAGPVPSRLEIPPDPPQNPAAVRTARSAPVESARRVDVAATPHPLIPETFQ